MNEIKISFIIPAYNAEEYIKKSIISILGIKESNIEVIVVDDGSKDRTYNIISQIDDSRLIVIKQNNQGVSAARNTGMKIAKGKYIAFIDADDYIDTDSYEGIINQIDYNKDLYMFGYKEMNNKEEKKILLPLKEGIYGKDEAQNMCKRLYDNQFSKNYNAQYFGGKVYQYLFSRKFLNEHKIVFFERVHFAEDCLFCVQSFCCVKRFQVIEMWPYIYRVVNTSASHRYRENFWNEMVNSYEIGCEIAGYELGHRNELFFLYGDAVIQRILQKYCKFSQYKMAINKIKEQMNRKEFQGALYNLSWKNWTLKEKILIGIYKKKRAFFAYLLYKLKYILKKIK